MSYKPHTLFSGSHGEASVDKAGPVYLTQDLEELAKMFDPNSTHRIDENHPTAEPGGISKDNLSFTVTNDYDNTEKSHVATAYTHATTTNANPHDTKAGQITYTPPQGVTGVNVQAAMDNLKTQIDTKASSATVALKETIADADLLIKNVTYTSSDGKFTFTKQGGGTIVVDTNLEKVPGSMALVEDPVGSGTYYLVIYDTSTPPQELSRCPVTSLFNAIQVEDTATIDLTLATGTGGQKKLTASVKDGSITNAKLNSEVTTTIAGYASSAQTSASNASASATNANTYQGLSKSYAIGDEVARAGSSTDNSQYYSNQSGTKALVSEGYALGKQNGVDVSSGSPYYHNNSKYYSEQSSQSASSASGSANSASGSATTATSKAVLSESWAVGGTGTRTGEDTNNAKYWCEQASAAVSADMKKTVYDPTLSVQQAGGIPSYVSTAISGKENTSNKVSSFQATPDDAHYPSEKLVKDCLDAKQDNLPNVVNDKFLHTNASTGQLEWVSVPPGVTVDRIYVDTMPTKTTYNALEVFDPSGMVIKGDYSNGSRVIIEGLTITGYSYDTSPIQYGTSSITITYTEAGVTKTTSVSISVIKNDVTIPTVNGRYTYNGNPQTVSWNNYDSSKMSKSGAETSTNAGSNTVTFSLIDSNNYQWVGGTTSDKDITWTIAKAQSSITPASASITLNSSTISQSVAFTKVGDGNISVSSSDTTVATVVLGSDSVTISSVNDKTGTATVTITQAEGSNYLGSTGTIAVTCSFVSIYGAYWDGSSNPAWTRTDASASFSDPVPYVAGASSYGSPFDNLMPWSGMVKSTDSSAGVVVAIPKFYYKLTKNGSSLKLQIADGPVEGFSVSPAHQDRGDGKGERSVVYIGRYHCSSSNYKSATGVTPKASVTRRDFRSSIHNLGSTIWQNDWAMRMTIWMLYIVEFAHFNSQLKIGYGCGNNSGTQNMGYTDSMPYHTGTTQSSRTTYGLGTQYRNIEGLWDNVYDWCDGCYYNSNGLNVIMNPNNFSDSSNGTNVGSCSNGYPSALALGTASGYDWAIRPTASSGSDSTYTCDSWNFSASYPCLFVGGYYIQYLDFGLFYVDYDGASYSYGFIGSRLQILP